MLRRIVLENYRCFARLDLEIPKHGLVVLIGPNGVGKSTVLESLDLLASAVATNNGLQEAIAVRGGLGQIARFGAAAPVRLQLTFAPEGVFAADKAEVEYEVVLAIDRGFPSATFEEIRVFKRGPDLAPLVVLHKDHTAAWVHNAKAHGKALLVETPQANDSDPVMIDPTRLLVSQVRQDELYPTVGHVRVALESMRAYGHFVTTSGWLATPSERTDGVRASAPPMTVARVHPRGLNLQAALFSFKDTDPYAWKRLLQDFTRQFPNVVDLDFGPAEGRIALRWRQRGHHQALSLDFFSDGMLAWLTLLAAVYLSRDIAAMTLDEPETHLHPGLIRAAVGLLETHARSVSPVIVATHSDRFLDWLEEPAMSLRILALDKDGSSSIASLDAAALSEWHADFRLGELRSRGHLDKTSIA